VLLRQRHQHALVCALIGVPDGPQPPGKRTHPSSVLKIKAATSTVTSRPHERLAPSGASSPGPRLADQGPGLREHRQAAELHVDVKPGLRLGPVGSSLSLATCSSGRLTAYLGRVSGQKPAVKSLAGRDDMTRPPAVERRSE
jgi:hypothetical protein